MSRESLRRERDGKAPKRYASAQDSVRSNIAAKERAPAAAVSALPLQIALDLLERRDRAAVLVKAERNESRFADPNTSINAYVHTPRPQPARRLIVVEYRAVLAAVFSPSVCWRTRRCVAGCRRSCWRAGHRARSMSPSTVASPHSSRWVPRSQRSLAFVTGFLAGSGIRPRRRLTQPRCPRASATAPSLSHRNRSDRDRSSPRAAKPAPPESGHPQQPARDPRGELRPPDGRTSRTRRAAPRKTARPLLDPITSNLW
jgi:hypothetical protein